MENKKLMTTKELAEVLRVHTNSIYLWRKQGLPTVMTGRTCKYDYEEVVKWMKTNK